MDIFVGSLPFKLKEEQLKALFLQYGEVDSVSIVIDKITRQNKGFGFVVMPRNTEAYAAIEALNGYEILGRALIVNESAPKKDTERRSFKGGNANGRNFIKSNNSNNRSDF